MAEFVKREESNCIKACRLLTDMGKSLLMKFLQQTLVTEGLNSLDAYLAFKKSHLKKLPKRILHQEQWDILFPKTRATDTNVWDITLASCVVTNCMKPLTIPQENAITTIRTLRNTLFGHIGEMKLDDKNFGTIWMKIKQDLTQAAKSLLNDHKQFTQLLQTKCNEIEQEVIVDFTSLKAVFESWSASDIELKSEVIQISERQEEHMKISQDTFDEITALKTGHESILQTTCDILDEVKEIKECHKESLACLKEAKESNLNSLPSSQTGRNQGLMLQENKSDDTSQHGSERVKSPSSHREQTYDEALSTELQHLQYTLIDFYEKHIIKVQATPEGSYFLADILDIYAKPELKLVEQTSKGSCGKYISFSDLFSEQSSGSRFRQIYVQGEAGMGKTSLCKDIVSCWCSTHRPCGNDTGFNYDTDASGQNTTDSKDEYSPLLIDEDKNEKEEITTEQKHKLLAMEQFDFLFFVSLRNAKKQYGIEDMIYSQLLNNYPEKEKILTHILSHRSDKCLIVLDGLDEWNAPEESSSPAVSDGIPGRDPKMKCTILTTSRSWKLEAIRLPQSEIDREVKLDGVRSIDSLCITLINYLNKFGNTVKSYNGFWLDVGQNLPGLQNIPLLFKQTVCLWHNDEPFGNKKAEIYSNLIELLFKLAEKREKVKSFNIDHNGSELQRPSFFKKGGRCDKYIYILLSLGQLAFETLFAVDGDDHLVFDTSVAEDIGLCEEYLDILLKVGLLSKDIIPNVAQDKHGLSFIDISFLAPCSQNSDLDQLIRIRINVF